MCIGLSLLETTYSNPDWGLEVGAVAIRCNGTSPIYSIYTKGLIPKLQIPLCLPWPLQTLPGLNFVLGSSSWFSWKEKTYACDMCPSAVFCLVMRQSATLLPARWRNRVRPRPYGWWHKRGKSLGGGGGVSSAVAQTAVSNCSAKTVLFHI